MYILYGFAQQIRETEKSFARPENRVERLRGGRTGYGKERRIMAKKKPSFEEALQRLKEITETLERGDVTLEESIKLFGEGTELSKLCYETLQTAEQKITELSKLGETEA